MRLMPRSPVGTGQHQTGWPSVLAALAQHAQSTGPLLDDFADASFSYRPLSAPHQEPWIGIFHHPPTVASPLLGDRKMHLRAIEMHPHWPESVRHLHGAIALSTDVAKEIQAWLGVPTLVLRHPARLDAPRWHRDAARDASRLLQAGFTLRNTELIYQFEAPGWHRVNMFGASSHYRARNEFLRRRRLRPDAHRSAVTVLGRQGCAEYDTLLASSVVVNEVYAASANNLTVECLARGTPLIINRLPAIEEYLGADYPLYYREIDEIAGLLDWSRLRDAHEHLLARAPSLPSFDQFADEVVRFVEAR